jgi:hypothetical protein
MDEANVALTAEDIVSMFDEYTKEDFISGDEPYNVLLDATAAIENELDRKRIENTIQELAKKKGCSKQTFGETLRAAKAARRGSARKAPAGFTGIEDYLDGNFPDYGAYSCSDRGVMLYDPSNGQTTVVCSHPVFPTRRYVNIETGSELIDLSFRRDGRWKTKTMIAKQTIAQARQIAQLSEFGISVTSENAKDMVKYLSAIDDLNREYIPRTETISRLGWVEGRGFSPYIEGVAYDCGGKFGDAYKAVHSAGSFEEWKSLVTRIRAENTNKAAQIVMAASVASVILKWTCNQPFMVHLWSTESGTGKTIALMLAASVWADPASGRYVKSLNSTNVAFEQLAAFSNNLPLCLDELQTIQRNSDFDDIIYMLCEGTGRARSTKNLGVREHTHWLNTIITNGEQPITNESKGGAINRVVSLETTGLVFPGEAADLGRIAETLAANYGFAGEMIVKRIFEEPELKEKISLQYRALVRELIRTATGKQANYGAALLTADWLLDYIVMKDGHRLKTEDVAAFLATPDMVDMNLRAKDWLEDFVVSCATNFRKEGESPDLDLNKQIYGMKMKDGTVCIIPSILRRQMRENKFDYTAFMKWCQEKGFIDTYHNRNGDTHWGKPVEIFGTGKIMKAIHFLPKTFETVEEQGPEAVCEPPDFPF